MAEAQNSSMLIISGFISPDIAPESGIFPERFWFGSFEPAKVDAIHRLAAGSGEAGRKDPGKNRIA